MSPPAVTGQQESVPLCVDLDGTLIRTDLLWESLVYLLTHKPLFWLAVPRWWLLGRANLKAQLAARVHLDVAALPYNEALVNYLCAEKSRGRSLVLVTASDRLLAREVGQYLGLFEEILASDGKTNLRGKNKGVRLVERFGGRGFDYAGNSRVDLPVWKEARQALVVNATPKLAAQARRLAAPGPVFAPRSSPWPAWVRTLRPQHWVKNLIILIPPLASHGWTDLPVTLKALMAFVIFSLCASGVYALNDLLDLQGDRHHPTRRLRPFPSGDLPLWVGLVLCPVLLAISTLTACRLSWSFAGALGIYAVLATSYSRGLKQVPVVNVSCLVGLYTIRLIAGYVAISK